MDAGFTGMTKNSLVVVGHLNFHDTRYLCHFRSPLQVKTRSYSGSPGNNIRPPNSISPYTGYRWTYLRGLGY